MFVLRTLGLAFLLLELVGVVTIHFRSTSALLRIRGMCYNTLSQYICAVPSRQAPHHFLDDAFMCWCCAQADSKRGAAATARIVICARLLNARPFPGGQGRADLVLTGGARQENRRFSYVIRACSYMSQVVLWLFRNQHPLDFMRPRMAAGGPFNRFADAFPVVLLSILSLFRSGLLRRWRWSMCRRWASRLTASLRRRFRSLGT